MQLVIKILESSSCEVSKEKYNKSKQRKKPAPFDPGKHKGRLLRMQGFLFQVTLSPRQLSV